jgi:hypothetical protein
MLYLRHCHRHPILHTDYPATVLPHTSRSALPTNIFISISTSISSSFFFPPPALLSLLPAPSGHAIVGLGPSRQAGLRHTRCAYVAQRSVLPYSIFRHHYHCDLTGTPVLYQAYLRPCTSLRGASTRSQATPGFAHISVQICTYTR